jgi:hypothetical protein
VLVAKRKLVSVAICSAILLTAIAAAGLNGFYVIGVKGTLGVRGVRGV